MMTTIHLLEEIPAERTPTEVFDDLYRDYYKMVHNQAKRMLRDEVLADDATAETFLRAWKYIDRHGDTGVGHDNGWLTTICRNVVIGHTRLSQTRHEELFWTDESERAETPADICVEDEVVDHLHNLAVREALSSVPDADRVLIQQVIIDQRPQVEIAREEGVHQPAISKRLRRALDRMSQNPELRALAA